MNRTLVFKNPKPYDLFLPTQSGAGRRLPAGKCVSGSFYIQLANIGHLVRVPEDQVVEEDVLWNSEVSGYQYKPVEAPVVVPPVEAPVVETPVVEEPPPVAEVPVAAPPVEAPETEESKELLKLGMEELKLVAATKGIDFPVDIKKKKLIRLILSSK